MDMIYDIANGALLLVLVTLLISLSPQSINLSADTLVTCIVVKNIPNNYNFLHVVIQ